MGTLCLPEEGFLLPSELGHQSIFIYMDVMGLWCGLNQS